ncbi:MAG: hypothetical protein L0219_09450 [Phycisphaerales bacterium]|nr:hypothetical protein [Phycisphaerales bacterium]
MHGALPDKCPRCGSDQVAEGDILGQTGMTRGIVFRPVDRKWWSFILPDARVSADGRACVDCGLLWTTVNPGRLKTVTTASERQIE